MAQIIWQIVPVLHDHGIFPSGWMTIQIVSIRLGFFVSFSGMMHILI